MNTRSALLALLVALTIVLASTTIYESGARTTLTSTSTLTQTTTVASTSKSGLSSIRFGPHAALLVNSSSGLGLFLQVEPGLNGSYTFIVTESNLLDSANNATEVDRWSYPRDSLSACGPDPFTNPVELAVVKGAYGQTNFTSAKALPFYNTGILNACGQVEFSPPTGYVFQPLNDTFSIYSGSTLEASGEASITFSTNGYWTGGQGNLPATFNTFSPGVYTLIGADEWGNVALLQAFLE